MVQSAKVTTLLEQKRLLIKSNQSVNTFVEWTTALKQYITRAGLDKVLPMDPVTDSRSEGEEEAEGDSDSDGEQDFDHYDYESNEEGTDQTSNSSSSDDGPGRWGELARGNFIRDKVSHYDTAA